MPPISADVMQIGIVKEATYGVTPANPVFEVLPFTSEGITADVSTTESAMMNPDRQVLDSILQSVKAGGPIATELAITPALEILIESLHLHDLVAVAPAISGMPPLKETFIGKDQISFTVEKRFPDPKNPGAFLYHRIPGCVANTMSFSVSPGNAATVSFGIIGTTLETDSSMLAGATYKTPVNPIVLRGPDVIGIGIAGATMATDCFGDVSVDVNNNYRGIQCLGHLGDKETVFGRASITAAARISFSSNALLDALTAQTESVMDIELKTPAGIDPGSYFAIHLPRIKLTGNAVVAGGTGQDVVNDLSAQALFNSAGTHESLGTNDADKTTMRTVLGTGAITA